MNFDQYIKEEGMMLFYGVSGNEFKLNDKVFEAVEDPDDGYRSYMESVEIRDSKGIFLGIPLGVVKVEQVTTTEYHDSFGGYQLVDVFTGHVWLTFGTDNWDDYYPTFVFEYTPDKSQTIFTEYEQ